MINWLKARQKKWAATSVQPKESGIDVTLEELIALQYQAKSLDFNTKRRVFTDQIGGHLSGFKGRGIDFEEVRCYQPPDDIRLIDWRVTARTGNPHTKVFHEERERPIYIVVNQNASMRFASRVAFKSVIAAKVAALFAWASIQGGHRVGGFIYQGEQCLELKPKSRQHGILPLLKALSDATQRPVEYSTSATLDKTLMKLRHVARPGSSIFLVSDFTDLSEDAEKQLGLLAKHCDISLCFIYDLLEQTPPPANQYSISDGQQRVTIDTHNPHFCKEYQQQFSERLEKITALSHRNRLSLLLIKTHDALDKVLKRGLCKQR